MASESGPEELAKKLDEEFESYLKTLGGKEYKDGWSEDNWEKEMEEHPAFTTKTDFEGGDLPPLVEALQQLKYSPDENTARELAQTYKEEGNRHFQLKKYRFAVASYTEGLKQKGGDPEQDAVLLANRAAAHFRLGNYRNCILDCARAVKLWPQHLKATRRGLEATLKLEKWDEASMWLGRLRQLVPEEEEEHRKIEIKIAVGKKVKARDERKTAVRTQKTEAEVQKLVAEVAKRGVRFAKSGGIEGGLEGRSVVLNKDMSLSWPVLLIYPEHSITELVEEFHESMTLEEQLSHMFAEPPDWDVDKKYKVENMSMFFEVYDTDKDEVVATPMELPLWTILSHAKYKIKDGMATFIGFVKGSEAEKFFLSKCIVHYS